MITQTVEAPTEAPVHPNVAAGRRFAEETADHEILVLHDDGLYKHLQFRRPESWIYHYELVTFPGHLTVAGDMGTWTFKRQGDMFSFFRNKTTGRDANDPYRINPGYWGEKLQGGNAGDGNRLAEEFSEDLFKQHVLEDLDEHCKRVEGDWPTRVIAELRAAVETDVLHDGWGYPVNDDQTAHASLAQFEFHRTVTEVAPAPMVDMLGADDIEKTYAFEFTDSWEWDFQAPSHRFLWICHAIITGIEQYDAHVKEQAATAAEVSA